MPEPLAQREDVERKLLRPLTDTETPYIDGLLDEASALLRLAAPAIDGLVARFNADPTGKDGVSPVAVAGVVAGAVKDYLSNPNGIVNHSETAGVFAESTSYALRGDKAERGVLQITPAALATLFPNRKRLRVGTFRLRPSLAPRPVGRYGPLPPPADAIEAAVTFGASPTEIQAELARFGSELTQVEGPL